MSGLSKDRDASVNEKTNDERTRALRADSASTRPSEIASRLRTLVAAELTQSTLVVGVGVAFPSIPIPVPYQVCDWFRVGNGAPTDEDIADFIRPPNTRMSRDVEGDYAHGGTA